jgi:hypothetical protein
VHASAAAVCSVACDCSQLFILYANNNYLRRNSRRSRRPTYDSLSRNCAEAGATRGLVLTPAAVCLCIHKGDRVPVSSHSVPAVLDSADGKWDETSSRLEHKRDKTPAAACTDAAQPLTNSQRLGSASHGGSGAAFLD